VTKRAVLLLGLMFASTSAFAEDAGARLFEPCRACHSLDPAERGLPGPNIAGLLRRQVGGDSAFDYSPALRKARDQGLPWDEARLDQFLTDPAAMFPGLWMATRGIEDVADRRALVRFLSDPASR
jgi:cytochrome c